MADWTKAFGSIITRTPITHAHATDGIRVGSAVPVADMDEIVLHMRWCGLEETANTSPGYFLVMGAATTGNHNWSLLDKIYTNASTPATQVLGDDTESGPVIELAATAGFTQGNGVYLRDVETESQSSWRQILGMITNTSITVDYALYAALNGDTDGDAAWTPADNFAIVYDVRSLFQINVHFSHQGAVGANGIIQVDYSAATDFV